MPARSRYPMPGFFREALEARELMDAYISRPPYQQNDYIGWVMRARTEATRLKRLEQMLEELQTGRVYMKIKWNPG